MSDQMKKAVGIFLGFFIVAVVAVVAVPDLQAADRPKILIKMATLASKNSSLSDVLAKVDKEVRHKSNNEVGFRVYYGGIQGDEKEAMQKVKFRQLHGGLFTASGLHRIVPAVHILSIPYLFRNYEEVKYVRDRIRDELDKRFLEKGYVVLAWGDAGFSYDFSKVPITSAAVARKQKFWQWGDDPVGMAMFRAMGVTPVSLSIADVMSSLSTRLIDAAGSTPSTAVALRWYTKFQYMSDYPTICVQGASIVRKDQWQKISPGTQNLIKALSQKYYDEYVKGSRKDDEKGISLLKKAGIKVVRDSDTGGQAKQNFKMEVSRKVREALVGKLYSRELLNKVLSYLAAYRKMHPDSAVEKIR
jgi:TRAP-type C4-dicarboxylate transport system substrate-binding protein